MSENGKGLNSAMGAHAQASEAEAIVPHNGGSWQKTGAASKYTLTALRQSQMANRARGGFVVTGEDRVTTYVMLVDDEFQVFWRDPDFDAPASTRVGLWNYYNLIASVARGLMAEWTPPEREDGREWHGIKEWACKQTEKALNKRVYAEWQRLLGLVDPQVRAVQRAIFAATFQHHKLYPEFYNYPYLIADILNYRAAAIAAVFPTTLLTDCRANAFQAAARPHIAELRRLAAQHGVTLPDDFISTSRYLRRENMPSTAEIIEAMHNWRALFSPTGEDYRSLNRTLMNLPGGIPAKLVVRLNQILLQRPMTKRLELLALLWCEGMPNGAMHARVFHYAREGQIKRAMQHVSEHLHTDLNTRKARAVRDFVQFVCDYPEPHLGTIVGLADKAIRWHRNQDAEEARRIADRLGHETPTALPPIAPPALPGVTFLDTVGDVCREGAEMGHCIASYAPSAVDGNSYLFHIDHNGELASVEVKPWGEVAQAQGPHNQANAATRWGARALRGWAAEIKAMHERGEYAAPQVRAVLPPAPAFDPNEGIPF